MRPWDSVAGTRPLPPLETIVPEPGQRLAFGQLSDVGMVRSNNQDAVYSLLASGASNDDLPDFGLFIVADGMGGHQEGERASSVTTRMVARHVAQEILKPMLEQRMSDPDRPPIADVLREAVKQANEAVTEEISDGGTTATLSVVWGAKALGERTSQATAFYRSLLERLGARTEDVPQNVL